jgi:hypothetical protein
VNYAVRTVWIGHTFRAWPPMYRGSLAALHNLAQTVADEHGLRVEDLVSHGLYREWRDARQDFMARAYATRDYSLPVIGRFLGRHHTTILHGIRAHERRSTACAYPCGQNVGQCKMSPPGQPRSGLASLP